MFDKDYPNRKDYRKKYYKSKEFDRTCRPGGSCPYCQSNRLHNKKKKEEFSKSDLKEFKDNQ